MMAMRLLACAVMLTACTEGKAGTVSQREGSLPPQGVINAVPLGDLAGAPEDLLRGEIHNPFGNDPSSVQRGEETFHEMNCVACHGYGAHGGMGPNLRDSAWRYGGTPVEIYKSIAEGRPKGMPAWGAMLPTPVIWQLVAYIQSLGGATPPEHVLREVTDWAGESNKGRRVDASY